jgi:anti-sigma regulatory factor (Ser/Thr protein kinase)
VGDQLVEMAVLLISELVTNAVLHGRGRPVVAVRARSDEVRVDVRDGDPSPPRPRDIDEEAIGGRGLHLVAELADQWGVDSWPGGGKAVWFLLRDH